MKGCRSTLRGISRKSRARDRSPAPASAIINGASVKTSDTSKQKTNAAGTAACWPSATRASGGPI